MRTAAFVFALAALSCQVTSPLTHRFDASADKVLEATLAVLAEYGEVTREGDAYETYWRPNKAPQISWRGTGSVLASESRFRVRLDGPQLFIEARSRLFVHRGTRRRDWEEVDSSAAAARLVERINARLR